MANTKTKKKHVFKFFTIADYEKEGQFLTDMAAKGWRFVYTNGLMYTFEQSKPEKVIYRLDYSGLGMHEREDYYAMFRDYGWEHLQDINGFTYFRKNGEGVSPEELEIFSDDRSRVDMMKRVLTTKFLPILVVWIASGLSLSRQTFEKIETASMDTFDWTLAVIYILLLFLECALTVHMAIKFLSLKKKYRNAE